MNCPRRRPRLPLRPAAAFSMLELLVVVVILMLLTTLFWGFETRGARSQKQKSCQANLQRIYVALDVFANDHTNRFPSVPGARTSESVLGLLIPRYTTDPATFFCPATRGSTHSPGPKLEDQRISYAFYMGMVRSGRSLPLVSDQQVDTTAKLAGQQVFSVDGGFPGNNHRKDGGNVLFTDGQVTHSPPHATFPLPIPPGVTLLNPKP